WHSRSIRYNREQPAVSPGQRSRSKDEASVRGTHQGQQSSRIAPTGRTHDCKRHLYHAQQNLLHGGGHPHMRRRDLLAALAGTALLPSTLRAQQKAMPVIGLLTIAAPDPSAPLLAAFREGLAEIGYIERRNVTIDYRYAEDHYDRLPALAADLVGRKVDLI